MKREGFLARLGNAGVVAGDSDEDRQRKLLLVLATGLVSLAATLWMALYGFLGLHFSSYLLPLGFQLLLGVNLVIYIRSGDFVAFRVSQLGLFLIYPFIAQWLLGTVVSASGLMLWGILAPVGAILCYGLAESLAWFLAYLALLAVSAGFDVYATFGTAQSLGQVPPRASAVFFSLNFAAVAAVVYFLLRFAIREKRAAQERLLESHELLLQEQVRSEQLLLNILPAPVAARLKSGSQTIADGFADVTVMFADIVNFTRVAEGLSPNQVFSMLNRIFSSFDELAERFGMERIKTIGDAYMVAGGLSLGAEDEPDYSAAIADMALAMSEVLQRDLAVNERRLEVRIGIGTGPVVAGVVGKKKFIYDLWGDTVNIASRLTSEGSPDMIHVDATTWRRLRDRFEFGPAEQVLFKGKGEMQVYRLFRRKVDVDPTQGNLI